MPTQVAPIGLVDVAGRGALERVEPGLADVGLADLVLQPVPAADVDEADDRQRQQRGDDDEELEHLVVDRRRQAAEADVGRDDERRDDDADDDRPAEHQLEHEREGVQVHPGDQDRRDRERDRVEDVRAVVEAQPQVLRHGADLRAVVERHHHEAEEDHGRDRADPVVVDRRDAVLGAVGAHAEHLDRAEVRGDEGEAGDPGGQRAAREEVVEARLDVALGGEADAEHDHEVRQQDRVVEPVRIEPHILHGGVCTPKG